MRQTLAAKFAFITAAIVAISLANGLVAMAFTRLLANSLYTAVRENLPSIKAAEELEIALANQRGIVSAYILTEGDLSWLERLRKAQAEFDHWRSRARASARTYEEIDVLDRLDLVFADYDAKRDKAILQFDRGQRNDAISTLLQEVWPTYDTAYQLCEQLILANEGYVERTSRQAERYVASATWGVLVGLLATSGLAVVLMWLLIRGVLIPLRRMLSSAHDFAPCAPGATAHNSDDELRAVDVYLRALMMDVEETRTKLAESRSRMLNVEKLAVVGKLAASVAHEMRNPLSSMKMWLYSIRKTTGNDATLDGKLGILSDEINQLESIVRNFLEFSRPPMLKLQPHSIVQVIEKTLELVRPWLEAKDIRVLEHHSTGLPRVLADSEQLKQVFTNLLHNSAEAMPEGGEISISTLVETDPGGSSSVLVHVQDTGQGIPDDVRPRLFEPFLTTKDDGTGLGLCIAANIMTQHHGQLVLESSTPAGTTFAVRIPIAGEKSDEQDPRR